MKKTMTLTFTRKETRTVEVEFPIYREHDVSGDSGTSIIYARIDEDGTLLEIHHRVDFGGPRDESFELKIGRAGFSDDADYVLGLGAFKSSAQQFREALKKAEAFLACLSD